MDSLCAAAARVLASGDPLGALKLVALRDDAPALALRGVAMAQLGELAKARELLQRATYAFGPRERVARARCDVARAEIALAARDLAAPWLERTLAGATRVLEAAGDDENALHARLLGVRRALLLGQTDRAASALEPLSGRVLPPRLLAIAELCTFELALRRLEARRARAAHDRALRAARRAGIAALSAEIERARGVFEAPAARLVRSGNGELLDLEAVETLLGAGDLVVDGLRRVVRHQDGSVSLATRPVLFAVAKALAVTWPASTPRNALIGAAFDVRRMNDSHRARLRVEVGRLRKLLAPVAAIDATADGFVLVPRCAPRVALLEPPTDAVGASVLALLADGEPWATSALALALGRSQRSVQRELTVLATAARVHAVGRARSRRWLATPAAGFTTALLLPTSLGSA